MNPPLTLKQRLEKLAACPRGVVPAGAGVFQDEAERVLALYAAAKERRDAINECRPAKAGNFDELGTALAAFDRP